MFRTVVSVTEGTPVIRVIGTLDHESSARFKEAADRIVAQATTSCDLLVDLSGSNLIDSAGLGALVSAHKRCVQRGGRLRLFGLNDKVAKLLGITHLNQLFEIHPDLASATLAQSAPSR